MARPAGIQHARRATLVSKSPTVTYVSGSASGSGRARSGLILEYHFGKGQIAAVRDRQRNILHAELVGDLACGAFEVQSGFAARFARHFNIAPSHAAPPAGPECLHGSFFGRKARGVALEFVLVVFAIGYFARGIDALEKRSAMARDGRADPVDFRNVQAKSNDHARLGWIIPIIDWRRDWRPKPK